MYPPPRIEILATPLQYRTWEEFIYEIMSEVPSHTKILKPLPLLLLVYSVY